MEHAQGPVLNDKRPLLSWNPIALGVTSARSLLQSDSLFPVPLVIQFPLKSLGVEGAQHLVQSAEPLAGLGLNSSRAGGGNPAPFLSFQPALTHGQGGIQNRSRRQPMGNQERTKSEIKKQCIALLRSCGLRLVSLSGACSTTPHCFSAEPMSQPLL